MYELMIENYLKNLTKDDVLAFSLKNNIKLNSQELDYVWSELKTNYKLLLSPNYLTLFEKSKSFLSQDNYEKILALYLFYREKYQNIFK